MWEDWLERKERMKNWRRTNQTNDYKSLGFQLTNKHTEFHKVQEEEANAETIKEPIGTGRYGYNKEDAHGA